MRTSLLILTLLSTPALAADPLTDAKRSVRESLKDPMSAQFRKVRIAPDRDRKRVCGEVNSKNGYGGYVGYQRFVYFVDTKESEILDEDFVGPKYVREKAQQFGTCFR